MDDLKGEFEMKLKRIAALAVTAAMMTSMLAGCGGSAAQADTAAAADSGSGADVQDVKVAAIFGGPITDKSWNETAYNGLTKIGEMGAETSYVENVEASAAPDAIRTFASSGYNVIYVNSSAFKDAAYEIAPEFPDVTFIINGVGEQGDNYASLTTANQEQGYIQGLLCAVATKDSKIGMICGTEMTPTLDCEAGFYQAIDYVNQSLGKNVESRVTYLGNYTDTSAGYETAMSFIAEGYDVMTTVADNASNAVLQACEEKGVLCVGNGIGQNEVAPKTLIAGVKKDNEPTYVESFNQYLDGTLLEKAGDESFGVNYGVVALDGYYDAASCYTEEEKQFIQDTMDKIASGEIKVLSMADYKAQKGE